eukprot:5116745-Pyramimonas_sp.AAC.1
MGYQRQPGDKGLPLPGIRPRMGPPPARTQRGYPAPNWAADELALAAQRQRASGADLHLQKKQSMNGCSRRAL